MLLLQLILEALDGLELLELEELDDSDTDELLEELSLELELDELLELEFD